MTIDEAIKHCLEQAERLKASCEETKAQYGETSELANDYKACADDHIQLMDWLMELKDSRNNFKETAMFIEELVKENQELKEKVSGGDILKICELEKELAQYKAKLNSASEAIKVLAERPDNKCKFCKFKDDPCMDCAFVYEHEDWFDME